RQTTGSEPVMILHNRSKPAPAERRRDRRSNHAETWPSQSQFGQSGMVVRASPLGPTELAVGFGNRQVVDAGDAQAHQAVLVELPVLVAVRPEPEPAVVMPFVCKTYGDPVALPCPDFLDQPILQFPLPFPGQKRLDCGAAIDELGPVSPAAVLGIAQRDTGGLA